MAAGKRRWGWAHGLPITYPFGVAMSDDPAIALDEHTRRILSTFAIPSPLVVAGEVDVPCGPGRFCARIRYDADGPILDSEFMREEYALAMEERLGGVSTDLALRAWNRRALHIHGLDDLNV